MKKSLQIILPIIIIGIIIGMIAIKNINNKNLKETNEGIYNETNLNIENIDIEQLKKYKIPVIIDLGADWCQPCKAMEPILVKLNKQLQGKAIIQFVDVWKNPEASKGFPVQLIPTQIIVEADGTPYVPSEEIAKKIRFYMYTNGKGEEHAFTVHQGGLTKEQMKWILKDMGVKDD